MEIPASRNNETAHQKARVTNMPVGVPIDFDVEIALVVAEKAIKTTDKLILSMRKNPDVSSKDVEEALDLGMPVDIMDTNGRTLLVTAAFTANTAAVKVLLNRGADANKGEFSFFFLLLVLLVYVVSFSHVYTTC
jgi:ankyrin repeat protein